MIKHFVLFFTVLLVFLVGMNSCYYDNAEDLYPGSSCDTTNISYSNDLRPLLDESCAYVGCHAGNSPSAQLDLTDYQDVKRIADNGQLVNRISRPSGDPGLMPPGGRLGMCSIEQIEAWVASGAPQN